MTHRTRSSDRPLHAWTLLPAAAAILLPVLLDLESIGQAASLFELADASSPYLVPRHGWLLYVRAPLTALSAFALCMAPGLLLAWTTCRSDRIDLYLLQGFGWSLIVNSLASAVAQAATDEPITGRAFAGLLLLLTLAAAAVTWVRSDGWAHERERLRSMDPLPLLLSAGVVWFALAALAPKIYWESFNLDGHEVFETSRLLSWRPLPFWDPESGLSHFPGFTTMLFAFPGSWFVRLFGEAEAAVRLPLFLYFAIVHAGLVEAASIGKPSSPGMMQRALLWLALLTCLVVQGYSVTYSPYNADLASLGTQDTLFVVTVLGYVTAFFRGRMIALALWQAGMYFCWPTGALVPLMLSAATLLAWRRRPWRRIGWSLAVLAGVAAVTSLAPAWLRALDLPAPGGEHGWRALVEERVHVHQVGAWLQGRFLWDPIHLQRWLWILLPSGVLPFFSLFWIKRQDELTRTLALLTGFCFLFFYVQVFVHIHYFVPAMILPLAVYWRVAPKTKALYAATALGALAALWLSLPENAKIVTEVQELGSAIESRLEGYDRGRQAVYAQCMLFGEAIGSGWEEGVPEQRFGIGYEIWAFYAHRRRKPGVSINYVLQRSAEPPPEDAELLARRDGVSLYVYDRQTLEKHRRLQPPYPPGSRYYRAPRWTMLKKRQPLEETWAEIRSRLRF